MKQGLSNRFSKATELIYTYKNLRSGITSGLSNTSSNRPLQIKLVKKKDGDKTYVHWTITAAYGNTSKQMDTRENK